jgi:hypothetical protein
VLSGEYLSFPLEGAEQVSKFAVVIQGNVVYRKDPPKMFMQTLLVQLDSGRPITAPFSITHDCFRFY